MSTIRVKTKVKEFTIPEGKPAIVIWKSKNKSRPGVSTAIGWLKHGEKPGTILLVHSAFQTYDKVEQDYPATWTIYHSAVLDIRPLQLAR